MIAHLKVGRDGVVLGAVEYLLLFAASDAPATTTLRVLREREMVTDICFVQ